ncbi:hypothetical protein GH865_05885 [Rhodocyclus tenuis]|uniref:hypothetical protein n=1 Tax=Rhodocyclus gracilis TaxID=2929842 RepID=UPI001298C3C9|nr:hypothetical protein [Rhodocyclus gracilis]MRD72781.1 hypothetical protein [Rhodocyclus gracilis]
MIVSLDPDIWSQWIADLLRSEVTSDGETYTFDLTKYRPNLRPSVTRNTLAGHIQALAAFESSDGASLYSSTTYEVAVNDVSQYSSLPMRLRGQSPEIADADNGLKYTIAPASIHYTLFLLQAAANVGEPRMLSRIPMRMAMERLPEENADDLFEVLRRAARILSVRIESGKQRSALELERHLNAFLFQVTYNLDAALIPLKSFEDLVRSGRLEGMRRSAIGDLAPPRRLYLPDLVYHYQLAVATESAALAYLSLYHVAEHFFEEIFSDNLVEKVRSRLTQPDFSYKRKKDISALIKQVGKAIQLRDERVVFSEQEALRLTLTRFVDLSQLATDLDRFDASLVQYYASTKVQFSGADEVDLQGQSADVFKQLANRIYRTRNSIVHSKESERTRYIPFRDDRLLSRELPLLRFIAEQITVSNSTVLA